MNTAEEINNATEKEVKVETDKARPVRLLIKKRPAEHPLTFFFGYYSERLP